MDKKEEVKTILDKHFEETADTAKDPCLRDIAKQICQLFPETETDAYFRGRQDYLTIKEFQTKPDEACKACAGTGKSYHKAFPCPICKGTGKVSRKWHIETVEEE